MAYPDNNFQALLEVVRSSGLPATINQERYARVYEQARTIHSDDALVAYKALMRESAGASLDDLLATASWMARQIYFNPDHPALNAGSQLQERLAEVRGLEQRLAQADQTDVTQRDALLQNVAAARARLTRTRAVISDKADAWRLRFLKTSIRSYREVAHAAFRGRGTSLPRTP